MITQGIAMVQALCNASYPKRSASRDERLEDRLRSRRRDQFGTA